MVEMVEVVEVVVEENSQDDKELIGSTGDCGHRRICHLRIPTNNFKTIVSVGRQYTVKLSGQIFTLPKLKLH